MFELFALGNDVLFRMTSFYPSWLLNRFRKLSGMIIICSRKIINAENTQYVSREGIKYFELRRTIFMELLY